MAQRLIEMARELGEHFRWPWDPPNTGGAVPAC